MAAEKCRGATAGHAPWTAEENALVRAEFGKTSARELAGRFGRSRQSVYHQAQRLGARAKLAWTREDDVELRSLWESADLTVAGIARRLGRTPLTTYYHARELGLPCGVPHGFEHLDAAAKRTGYDRTTLFRVLEWARVPVRRAMSKPVRRTPRVRIFDPMDVDDAIARWHETETLEAAARRLGSSAERLRRRLYAIGVRDDGRTPKTHWRVRSIDAERAAA